MSRTRKLAQSQGLAKNLLRHIISTAKFTIRNKILRTNYKLQKNLENNKKYGLQ